MRIEEAPRGVPGEVRVTIGLLHPGASSVPPSVTDRIEELRPAGVRVLAEVAGTLFAAARVRLVLAGSGLPDAELVSVQRAVADTLSKAVAATAVGQPVRTSRLVAAVLADERVLDAVIALGEKGGQPGAPGADLDPGADSGVMLAVQDVSFEKAAIERAAAAPTTVAAAVRATVRATIVGDATPDTVKAQVSERLERYLAGLAPPGAIAIASVLDGLRDDAAYQLDPLGVRLTIAAGDQFVEVAVGGPSFTVGAAHRLSLVAVEVST